MGAVDRGGPGPARHDQCNTSQKNTLSTICGQDLGTACVRTRIVVDVMWMNAFNTPDRTSIVVHSIGGNPGGNRWTTGGWSVDNRAPTPGLWMNGRVFPRFSTVCTPPVRPNDLRRRGFSTESTAPMTMTVFISNKSQQAIITEDHLVGNRPGRGAFAYPPSEPYSSWARSGGVAGRADDTFWRRP